MSDTTIPLYDGDDRTDRAILYHQNSNGSFSPTAFIVGGTPQFGHIAVLANGEGEDADEEATSQVAQLPDIPCRKVVIAYPSNTIVTTGLAAEYPDGTANDGGRLLFYGDQDGQFFALEAGQAEELEVSNANQIFLRDVGFSWEDFNGDGHLSSYVIIAFWRVIK